MRHHEIPVAIHMWFADGDGWAYYPSMGDQLIWLRNEVSPYLKSVKAECKFAKQYKHGVLVGEKTPDRECRDPKAARRKPTILRVAYIAGLTTISEEMAVAVVEALRQLSLPRTNGLCQSLHVTLSDGTGSLCDDARLAKVETQPNSAKSITKSETPSRKSDKFMSPEASCEACESPNFLERESACSTTEQIEDLEAQLSKRRQAMKHVRLGLLFATAFSLGPLICRFFLAEDVLSLALSVAAIIVNIIVLCLALAE